MEQRIEDVMTPNPVTMEAASTVVDAARAMRNYDIGAVVVLDGAGNLHGIVTDRDVAVRVVAEDRDPGRVEVGEICSKAMVTISPADEVAMAVRLMREQALRRLPVVHRGWPVGIVSLGDLALERDPGSALADISTAPANT